MEEEFQVTGKNGSAPFTLKIHRGDGMALLAMNWKGDKPPPDFVGFGIEYKEPKNDKFFVLRNRLSFEGQDTKKPNTLSTLSSPIQKFRWVHFPRNAERTGEFTYRVTPIFMNDKGELSQGEAQTASLALQRETYAGKMNVTFTRGFVSSQAFVDRYESAGPISKLLPKKADDGLKFEPTHPKADEALEWMGFEARSAIIELLDSAIADKKAEVRVVAYDLSEAGVVSRLEKLGKRLKIIIDDDGSHGKPHSGESQAAAILRKSAGAANVKRQHMGNLQHNKTIIVDGPKVKAAVAGSTNFSWRGFFVQSNNALVVRGAQAIAPFLQAFDAYWEHDKVAAFGGTAAARRQSLGFSDIDAEIAFSPHTADTALLKEIADDISKNTKSSLLYSLAFLFQTPGLMQSAIKKVMQDPNVFVYGISDRKVGGLDLHTPGGNISPVFPANLAKASLPEPFKTEPTGGSGIRMHHKFLVVDFDRPTARVYLGSYNFSNPADTQNGENLVIIRDRKIAVSYMIEALRIFDHYHFRVLQQSKSKRKKLVLAKPPRKASEKPWWHEDYTDPRKIRDREIFA